MRDRPARPDWQVDHLWIPALAFPVLAAVSFKWLMATPGWWLAYVYLYAGGVYFGMYLEKEGR